MKQTWAYLYLIVTTSIWGSNFVATKLVLAYVPPFTLLFLRYLLAGITLSLLLRHRPPVKIAGPDRIYVFAIGFVGYFFSIGAQLLGTKLANASLASLVNSLNPISIILFASLILKEKLTRTKVVAVTAAVAGTYIIIGGAGGGGQLIGILLSVISVLAWSLITVVARRINQKYDPLTITTYGMLIASFFTLPPALYEFATTSTTHLFRLNAVLLVLYIGLICTALSHFLWNKSLSLIDAGSCSLFYPIQPLTATLLGWLLLGEHINLSFVAGAVLIIGGVLFGVLGGQQRQPTSM